MDKRVWIGYCAAVINTYCVGNGLHNNKYVTLKVGDFKKVTANIIEKDTRHTNEDIFELSSMVLQRMFPSFFEWDRSNGLLHCNAFGLVNGAF